MDYEKAYKEALNWMRSIYATLTGSDKEDAEHYFPELIESKDERIRKAIISIVKEYGRICEKEGDPCYVINDCLAYLEKQKEQKPNKQTEIEIEEAVEKAALEFAYQYPLENGEYGVAKFSFMRGAEWQRQQGIVWSEKDEEKKASDKGFKAAKEFYCGRII